MFFIRNKKFESLEYVYEFLKDRIKNYSEGKDEPKNLNLIIYYDNDLIYNSSTPNNNHIFYTSRGVKGDLLDAFVLKYKGVKGTVRYKNKVLWEFN